VAEDAPENVMLKELAVAIGPDAYALRLSECETEKASWSTLLPIFYYNDCLFPGSRLSLHLFEQRYRVMMQRVVNTTRSFAYVPNFSDYRAKVGDVALIAQLEEVEFMADGRCVLEAKLTSRHIIVDHYVEEGTQGLHFCRLQKLDDDPIIDDAIKMARCAELMQVSRLLTDALLEGPMRSRIEQRYGSPPTNPEAYSLWLCQIAPLRDGDKVMLLKTTDTLFRLEATGDSLQNFKSSKGSLTKLFASDSWEIRNRFFSIFDHFLLLLTSLFFFPLSSTIATIFGEVVRSMQGLHQPPQPPTESLENNETQDSTHGPQEGENSFSADGILSHDEIAEAEGD